MKKHVILTILALATLASRVFGQGTIPIGGTFVPAGPFPLVVGTNVAPQFFGPMTITGNPTNVLSFSQSTSTNLVPYGPADGFIKGAVPQGTGNFGPSSGQTSVEWLQDGNTCRLRLGGGGTIKAVQIYLPSTNGMTGLFLKDWSTNSGGFNLVGTSDNLISKCAAGSNFVTLGTPIAGANEGDWSGFYVTYSAASAQNFFLTNSGFVSTSTGAATNASTNYYVLNSAAKSSGFAWYGATASPGVVCAEVYATAPVLLGFGDSLTSGAPTNNGFISSQNLEGFANPTYPAASAVAQLGTRLGVTWENMGVPGQTSYQIMLRTNDVALAHPQMVLYNAGYNDSGTNGWTETNLWLTVQLLTNVSAGVLWNELYPAGSNNATAANFATLNNFIDAMGASNGVRVVNASPYIGSNYWAGGARAWYQQSQYSGDTPASGVAIHWNPAGYGRIAQADFDALQNSLPLTSQSTTTVSGKNAAGVFGSSPTNGVRIGYETNSASGVIQAGVEGVGPSILSLNDKGGNVGVNLHGAPAPYPLSVAGDEGITGGSLYVPGGGGWFAGGFGSNPNGPGLAIQESGNVMYVDGIGATYGSSYVPIYIRPQALAAYLQGIATYGLYVTNGMVTSLGGGVAGNGAGMTNGFAGFVLQYSGGVFYLDSTSSYGSTFSGLVSRSSYFNWLYNGNTASGLQMGSGGNTNVSTVYANNGIVEQGAGALEYLDFYDSSTTQRWRLQADGTSSDTLALDIYFGGSTVLVPLTITTNGNVTVGSSSASTVAINGVLNAPASALGLGSFTNLSGGIVNSLTNNSVSANIGSLVVTNTSTIGGALNFSAGVAAGQNTPYLSPDWRHEHVLQISSPFGTALWTGYGIGSPNATYGSSYPAWTVGSSAISGTGNSVVAPDRAFISSHVGASGITNGFGFANSIFANYITNASLEFGLTTTNALHVFAGWHSVYDAAGGYSNTNGITKGNYFGIDYNQAFGDTNWFLVTCDNSTTSNRVQCVNTPNINTSTIERFQFFFNLGANNIVLAAVTGSAVTYLATNTTHLPSSGSAMYFDLEMSDWSSSTNGQALFSGLRASEIGH